MLSYHSALLQPFHNWGLDWKSGFHLSVNYGHDGNVGQLWGSFKFWLWYKRWFMKGEAWGTTTFCVVLQTNADAFSQQRQQRTYPPTPHPAAAHDTQCRTCKERHGDVSSSSYSANSTSSRAKLQQPHQQGDAQAHMIRRSLPKLSNLWRSSETLCGPIAQSASNVREPQSITCSHCPSLQGSSQVGCHLLLCHCATHGDATMH